MNIKKEKRFKIGGENRLFKFGTNSTSIFCNVQEVSLVEAQAMNLMNKEPGVMRDLIYSGLAAGALKSENLSDIGELDFTKWDVGDWIDEMEQEVLQDIHDFMFEVSDKKKPEQD